MRNGSQTGAVLALLLGGAGLAMATASASALPVAMKLPEAASVHTLFEPVGQGPRKREGWTYKRNEHGDRYPYRYRNYRYYYGGYYYVRPWWFVPDPFWVAPRYTGPVYYDYGGWYRGYYDGNDYGGGDEGGGYNNAHVDWCMNRYRSYNVHTDTFRGYDGYDHRCISPF